MARSARPPAVAADLEDEDAPTPFDASALGIAGVRFTLEMFHDALATRPGITRVDADITFTSFAYTNQRNGIGDEGDRLEGGVVTEWFENIALPSWSDVDNDPDTDDRELFPFDPTQIHSLQFHVVTQPGFEAPYDFCVSEFMWLDEDGNEVVSE